MQTHIYMHIQALCIPQVFGDVQNSAWYLQICEECGGVETILIVGTSYRVDKGIQGVCQN
jgi:hypothetical protein